MCLYWNELYYYYFNLLLLLFKDPQEIFRLRKTKTKSAVIYIQWYIILIILYFLKSIRCNKNKNKTWKKKENRKFLLLFLKFG